MPLDFGLLGGTPRINTPFENLSTILQVRNQQAAAQGLAEERQGRAEERRMKAQQAQQEAQQAAQFKALWSRTDPATGQPVMPTIEESAAIIGPENAAKVFKGLEEVQKAKWDNQQAAVQGVASILDGIEAWPAADRQTAYDGARKTLIAQGKLTPKDAPEQYNASWVAQMRRQALTAQQRFERDKAPADYTLGDQRISGATNQPIATAAPAAPKPAALGSFEDYVNRYASQRRLKPEQLSAGDVRVAKAQYEAAGRAPQSDNEPLVAVIGPDGRPVLVRRSQAEGKTPASTREQGRPVTSGDAGRIADLDTSLDDIAVLGDTLGTTGAGSKVGAMLPKVVTELTGWGADAKARQGTIDRVKQVIGKALEGGVLRKEDEVKYEKILPTIGDPPSVAKAKLEGLKKALIQRRQTTLDALADAGYETSKFETRTGQRGGAAPAGGKVTITSIKEIK